MNLSRLRRLTERHIANGNGTLGGRTNGSTGIEESSCSFVGGTAIAQLEMETGLRPPSKDIRQPA